MSASHFNATPLRTRGAVNLIAVMFLFTVVMAVLGSIMLMSATDIADSQQQSDSVKAFLLAESGVERAMGRLALGTACASLAEASVTQGSGSISISAPTVVVSDCQFQASGSIGNVTRRVSALATIPAAGCSSSAVTTISASAPVSTTGAGTSRSLSYTVPANASILLVGVSADQATTNITVSYGGTALSTNTTTLMAVGVNPWPKAQVFYLKNPPSGTATVQANFSVSTEAVVGAMAFSGVDVCATPPFEAMATIATTNSRAATVPITTLTTGAWAFEVLAINANDPTTMTAAANRSQRWYAQSNGNVRGGASTTGSATLPAGTTPTTQWTWTGNPNKWAQVAVVMKPGTGGGGGGGTSSLLTWSEVISQ